MSRGKGNSRDSFSLIFVILFDQFVTYICVIFELDAS